MAAPFTNWTAAEKRRILELDVGYIQSERAITHLDREIVRVDLSGRSPTERAQDGQLIARLSDDEFAFLRQYHALQREADASDARGDWRGAIRAYEQMFEMAPWDAIAPMSIGVSYAHQGSFVDAIAWLERAATTDPQNERVLRNLHAVRVAARGRR
jgi:tetratricopeptide (TPR) repeat protein